MTKVTLAGKGGVGKTTVSGRLARALARSGVKTLAVDCDPNPNLAESFGLDSRALDRFARGDLDPGEGTLVLGREPVVVPIEEDLWILGGPPSNTPLADAVARGIAGVLLADRYAAVVTDLGAGPELARIAVGGVLNPADVCVVLSDGRPVSDLTAERVVRVCAERGVPSIRVLNRPGGCDRVAADLAALIRPDR